MSTRNSCTLHIGRNAEILMKATSTTRVVLVELPDRSLPNSQCGICGALMAQWQVISL